MVRSKSLASLPEAVGDACRRLREARGQSRADLEQDVLQRAGYRFPAQALMYLEIGRAGTARRVVDLEALCALAVSFDTSPMSLLTAPVYQGTLGFGSQQVDRWDFARWFLGYVPLPGQDEQTYRESRPLPLSFTSGVPTKLRTAALQISLLFSEWLRALEAHDPAAGERAQALLDGINSIQLAEARGPWDPDH